jgi:hypothetical protein
LFAAENLLGVGTMFVVYGLFNRVRLVTSSSTDLKREIRAALQASKWFAISTQHVGLRERRPLGNGQWAMGNGQWAMGNGQWAMGNGQWAMGNGQGERGVSVVTRAWTSGFAFYRAGHV